MTVASLKPKPDEEIVSALRVVLAKAEKGEVQQLAMVISERAGEWTTWYIGNSDALVAGLERIKFRILKEWA